MTARPDRHLEAVDARPERPSIELAECACCAVVRPADGRLVWHWCPEHRTSRRVPRDPRARLAELRAQLVPPDSRPDLGPPAPWR